MDERQRLVQNLRTIGSLNFNDKVLTVGDVFHVSQSTFFQSLRRRWYGENRSDNIDRLGRLFYHTRNECDLIFAKPMKTREDAQALENMVSGLEHAVTGLRNLAETYRDDVAIKSRLEIFVTDIESYLGFARAAMSMNFDPSSNTTSPASQASAPAYSLQWPGAMVTEEASPPPNLEDKERRETETDADTTHRSTES